MCSPKSLKGLDTLNLRQSPAYNFELDDADVEIPDSEGSGDQDYFENTRKSMANARAGRLKGSGAAQSRSHSFKSENSGKLRRSFLLKK